MALILTAILYPSLLELFSSKQEVFFMAHDPAHPEEVWEEGEGGEEGDQAGERVQEVQRWLGQ